MNIAPEQGAGTHKEKGPRRVQPAKALRKSIKIHTSCSAPAHLNQPLTALDVWESRDAFGFRNVVTKTRKRDDRVHLAALTAAGARAGHTLNEMKRLLRHWGMKHPPAKLQRAWLHVGVAQYVAIRASTPRWTLGLHGWVRRYLPEIYRTWPADRIDALARKIRRDGTSYSPEQKGAMLGVDRETYLALRLVDIWAAGMSEHERAQDRRTARNARDRANTLASGKVKKPHDQSIARRKPWEALGISERTYYRHQKSGKLAKAA